MAKKSEADRSGQNSGSSPERQKGKEDILTDEDVYRVIVNLKDRNGATVSEIRNYLISTVDKYKNFTARHLEANIKKATIKGIQAGRICRKRGRFMAVREESMANVQQSKTDNQGTGSQRNRRRYSRRRRGKCRVKLVRRKYCSRYKRRCCRRKRKCRASKHRSKRPVCSRYKYGCCRRRPR